MTDVPTSNGTRARTDIELVRELLLTHKRAWNPVSHSGYDEALAALARVATESNRLYHENDRLYHAIDVYRTENGRLRELERATERLS